MAERTIVGVDFSGALTNNTTQTTVAVLHDDYLELKPRERLPRSLPSTHDKLAERIKRLPNDTVVALDFPFSVPLAFAMELAQVTDNKPPSTMPDVWSIVAKMDRACFKKLLDCFVERHGEVMRRGDSNFAGPFSPLHAVRPSMWQMTYEGMRMLHQLRQAGCRIPPLPDKDCNKQVLLETMPGVLLRIFRLPHERYKKSYRDQKVAKENRETILAGLSDKETSGVLLKDVDQFREEYVKDDDYLDSLVAAVGAARWAMNKSEFLHPRESISPKQEIQAARLEGWIYAPKK